MIGVRRGPGGSFRQGLLAYHTANTTKIVRSTPAIRVLSSKIGLTIVSSKRPGAADISRKIDEASRSRESGGGPSLAKMVPSGGGSIDL